MIAAYVVPDATRAATARDWVNDRASGSAGPLELRSGIGLHALNRAETDFLDQEIFERNVYVQHGVELRPNATVIDVGAHVGAFSLFAHVAAPGCRIIAIEPLPPLVQLLRRNVAMHGMDATIVPCAIGAREETAGFTFYEHCSVISGRYADGVQDRAVISAYLAGTDRGRGAPSADAIARVLDARLDQSEFVCPVRTLSSVMRTMNIERVDLLKIDVERAEMDVLAGIEIADWPRIEQCTIEVHDVDARVARVVELLEQLGFLVHASADDKLAGTKLWHVYARRQRRGATATTRVAARPALRSLGPRAFLANLRSYLQERLPEYMLPAIVLIDRVPLTSNGKVDMAALPRPSELRPEGDLGYAAPRSPAEQAVAKIWQDLLGVSDVSAADDFFDLGGHSLLAPEVVARLRSAFGVEVPLRVVFEAPTLRELAASVAPATP